MGATARTDLKVRQRPGAVQTTVVVLAGLALLVLAAYAGYLLLTGQSIGFDIHWLEEVIRRYLN